MYWPNDIDGDVFKRLESHNFDFSKQHEIEFIIDFDTWPLPTKTISEIEELFPECEFIEPDEEDIRNGDTTGYVQFYITEMLTYKFIINKQKEITKKVKPFGGWCDSWGVMTQ
ncbi:MAG: ribonuclease E inhibitor RraB [Gammaproteobacteria bacterium]|nr:ribonuclease E inhibitor RraB [Gammaproteobacteria bacterium]